MAAFLSAARRARQDDDNDLGVSGTTLIPEGVKPLEGHFGYQVPAPPCALVLWRARIVVWRARLIGELGVPGTGRKEAQEGFSIRRGRDEWRERRERGR